MNCLECGKLMTILPEPYKLTHELSDNRVLAECVCGALVWARIGIYETRLFFQTENNSEIDFVYNGEVTLIGLPKMNGKFGRIINVKGYVGPSRWNKLKAFI